MKPARVLVMDPSGTVRSHYLEALAAHGLQADGCATGAALLEQVEGPGADVVVIDCPPHDHEPDKLVQDLLAIPLLDVGIILLTSDPAADAGNRTGPRVRVLHKPDNPAVLVHEVLDLLHGLSTDAVRNDDEERPTVLLVDDSITFRAALRGLLSLHWDIREADSGGAAVALATAGGIDAVLLDVGLPDISGTEVCRALRRDDDCRGLPIIMLTAADDDAMVLAAFAAGADDYVVKGCRDEVLLARIGAHVRRRRTDLAVRRAETGLRTAEAVSAARADLLAQVNRQAADLRRANEDLERFAALASHDLQAPLRAVSNHLGLVQRRATGLDERTRAHLDMAIEASVRMGELIKRLLHYASKGWDDTTRDLPCDTAALARDAAATLEQHAGECGARIAIDDLPWVVFDPLCLKQVFENLISNAIKYRGARPPEIRVASRAHDGGVALTVSDNGEGIAPEHLERVFGMFERLHGAEVPGAGIGLALCRKIVLARGGTMGVESRPGEGSLFWFSVPAARVVGRAAASA